jgi:hypothetical protein
MSVISNRSVSTLAAYIGRSRRLDQENLAGFNEPSNAGSFELTDVFLT